MVSSAIVLIGFTLLPAHFPSFEVKALAAQAELADQAEQSRGDKGKKGDVLNDSPDTSTQLEQLRFAIVRLPIAAVLSTVLAVRPRRRGTPPRQPAVIQTQIILGIVGAVVMLVVGSSLARAFGIVGAAGLVRYRARIEDPKDAGVMLSTLAVGLAAGVGTWMLAAFGPVFILVVLWIVESFEPTVTHLFVVSITAKNAAALKPKVEELLLHHRLHGDLRSETNDVLKFDVKLPITRSTDHLSEAILAIDKENISGVEWEEKKEKK